MIKSGMSTIFGRSTLFVEQFLDDAEAIEAGHLYVEKDQIGVVLADPGNLP